MDGRTSVPGNGPEDRTRPTGQPVRTPGVGIMAPMAPTSPGSPAVADEKYVVLTTFTKDGRPKPTPVWIVPFEGAAAVWTVRDSWKVKRVRASGRVQVQGSDVRGKRTHGATYAGVGHLLDDEASARVAREVVRKYGLLGRLTVLGSRVRRGGTGTVGILLEVERAEG